MNKSKDKKWLLWVLLIFLPPIGIVYMWVTKKDFTQKTKIILSVVFSLWFIIALASGNNNNTTNQQSVANQVSTKEQNTNNITKETKSAISNEIKTKLDENITSNKYTSLSQLELDELQQLYLNFDSSMSYLEALEYIQNTELPYSIEKYNGYRTFQIAFTEGCTAQKYKKESGAYLTITYRYAKGENSINDDFSKYSFGTCVYVSTGISLITHDTGYYFDIYSKGTYIKQGGNTIDNLTNLNREEQLLYYFNNHV